MNLSIWNPLALDTFNSRLTYFPIKSSTLLEILNHEVTDDDDITTTTVEEYKSLIQYSCLLEYCPEGIYIVPEFDNMYCWQGGIFVRAGLYKESFYRFKIDISCNKDKRNLIYFLNPPYHPLINSETGLLYIPKDWEEQINDDVLSLVFFLKNIFYLPDLITYKIEDNDIGNKEASEAINNNAKEAYERIKKSVESSIYQSSKFFEKEKSPFKIEDKNEGDKIVLDIIDNIKKCCQSSTNLQAQKDIFNEWLTSFITQT
ncbi:ubiquitin-conjugating enzyme family protein [Cryptosporidium muris RN66]|uniref:Ubiquitin-conjugating enzyme family protein n=1 Tax=Cryptosporidium muris (strain RN66) TaxID=441375 RepID=B6AE84_CRYMR|nr:ubiquitin-conjugating enzyme family protein [Cryptosporidium muris RN66]EEA06525.1 ubiquitin-conjugating enzyme family protein [Cryptosporidium muris RN66]|eukprot:XP_002140874.1 ubiquitin-conjugating enzyme family protein [Cryptosporidium muris RN66]